ncbi:MAG: DUF1573 domain-containing protein [Bacteroidales bacterium]|nr:DUF1573 domain-containing protein [Bacteroidales bacterium]
MKKIILSIISISLIVNFVCAQQKGAFISFDKTVHDFGKVKEDGGRVEYKFEYTNTGSAPLIITNVRASCGCTSPTWTQQPVMPGQKGFVTTMFNPIRRPGMFNKSITVETNSQKSRNVLRITGEVIPRVKTVNDYYPKTIGNLRLETNHFAFVKVYNNQIKKDTLKIFNSSDSKMTISFENVPSYLTLKTSKSVLNPKEKAFIVGEYDGNKVNDWGFITSRVKVKVNNQQVQGGTITISAKIEEDFSNLTEKEIKNAPKIVFDNRTFNFGKRPAKQKIDHEFKFKNEGKRDLVIRKIRATCGCTTADPSKKILKPGESSSFKVTFNPGSRKGRQRKSLYVICNDPKNSNVRLMINGELE